MSRRNERQGSDSRFTNISLTEINEVSKNCHGSGMKEACMSYSPEYETKNF
jgi:hypothetical protein